MRINVKICGIKTTEALNAAVKGGAAFVGFVFHPASPRNLSLDAAASLRRVVPPGVKAVALVVDADDGLLRRINAAVRPDIFQLQGAETVRRAADIRGLTGAAIIKAIPVARADDIGTALPYQAVADWLMFDTKPRARRRLAWRRRPKLRLEAPGRPPLRQAVASCGRAQAKPKSRRRFHLRGQAGGRLVRRRARPGRQGRGLDPALSWTGQRPSDIASRHDCGTTQAAPNSLRSQPDERGRFGTYGGRFVAETLMPSGARAEDGLRGAKREPNSRQSSISSCATMSAGRARSITRSV